ncbi:MAG: hypothetical protein IPL53_23405 [Ignavibacteria bacterium]|nr:hypothetical protein [Ignavibacteria bacterium]
MLNRIFTLLSLAVIILFSASDMVSAQGFNSITTPDGTNIIAAGNAGKLYRSANGGIGYSSYTISGTPNIYSVTSFGNDVWMAGDNGNVIKTLKTASSNTFYNVGDAAPLKSVFLLIQILVSYADRQEEFINRLTEESTGLRVIPV